MGRILIIANHIDWLYSLRKELIEKLNKNYSITVSVPKCAGNFKLNYFENMGVNFHFINFNGRSVNFFSDLLLLKNYYKLIKHLNPDIVFTYTVKPNIYASVAGKLLNQKNVINITGLGSGFHSGKFIEGIIKGLYTLSCKFCEFAFFQNESNMRMFVDQGIVRKDKARLIPGSGVNIEMFKPMNKTKIDNTIRFLFIGRIMREKGIEEYLKVAENLTQKHYDIEFQILGSFEETKYKKIIFNNKNDRIKYLGRSDDVRNEIREVDCIVHPSYHEGMSNVLLEGAAMGKPLIASDIPGCKEIIDEGYNGFLFEVKSAESMEKKLIQFIELDEKTKKEMGQNSRKKVVEEFDRQIVIDEYMKAINEVLRKG